MKYTVGNTKVLRKKHGKEIERAIRRFVREEFPKGKVVLDFKRMRQTRKNKRVLIAGKREVGQ